MTEEGRVMGGLEPLVEGYACGSTGALIVHVCREVEGLLLEKNARYGDSALDPVRIMSKADVVEQLLVRIDDKLSRLARGTGEEREDVELDLLGYLVLLRAARRRINHGDTGCTGESRGNLEGGKAGCGGGEVGVCAAVMAKQELGHERGAGGCGGAGVRVAEKGELDGVYLHRMYCLVNRVTRAPEYVRPTREAVVVDGPVDRVVGSFGGITGVYECEVLVRGVAPGRGV